LVPLPKVCENSFFPEELVGLNAADLFIPIGFAILFTACEGGVATTKKRRRRIAVSSRVRRLEAQTQHQLQVACTGSHLTDGVRTGVRLADARGVAEVETARSAQTFVIKHVGGIGAELN